MNSHSYRDFFRALQMTECTDPLDLICHWTTGNYIAIALYISSELSLAYLIQELISICKSYLSLNEAPIQYFAFHLFDRKNIFRVSHDRLPQLAIRNGNESHGYTRRLPSELFPFADRQVHGDCDGTHPHPVLFVYAGIMCS